MSMEYLAFHREMKCKNTLAEGQMWLMNNLHSGTHKVLLKQVTMEKPYIAFMSWQGNKCLWNSSFIPFSQQGVLLPPLRAWAHAQHSTFQCLSSAEKNIMPGTKFTPEKCSPRDFTPAIWQGKSPKMKKMHWRSSDIFTTP